MPTTRDHVSPVLVLREHRGCNVSTFTCCPLFLVDLDKGMLRTTDTAESTAEGALVDDDTPVDFIQNSYFVVIC